MRAGSFAWALLRKAPAGAQGLLDKQRPGGIGPALWLQQADAALEPVRSDALRTGLTKARQARVISANVSRAAWIVSRMTSSVWAIETKPASNVDGAK